MGAVSEKRLEHGATVWRAVCVSMCRHDKCYIKLEAGQVSSCGDIIAKEGPCYRFTSEWRATAAEAEADLAEHIEAIGRRYIAQAAELRRRAEA